MNTTVNAFVDIERGQQQQQQDCGCTDSTGASPAGSQEETLACPTAAMLDGETVSASSSNGSSPVYERSTLFCALIVLMGTFASSLFLGLGISWAVQEQQSDFELQAIKFTNELEASWADYLVECLWIHEACRSREKTRLQFRELFEYLKSGGLDFRSVAFAPNITLAERADYEAQSRAFYSRVHPDVNYIGITEADTSSSNEIAGNATLRAAGERPYDFPLQLVEPLLVDETAGDFDLYSSAVTRQPIMQALDTWQPAISSRLPLGDKAAYGVLVLHPGTPLSTKPDLRPRDLAQMFIEIDSIVIRSLKRDQDKITAYLFDVTDPKVGPSFLGGSDRLNVATDTGTTDPTLETLLDGRKRSFRQVVNVAGRKWEVVCLPTVGFKEDLIFIIFGGAMIFVACITLALFVYTSMRRVAYMHRIKAQSEAEKAALLLDSAKASAKTEREMNDFIAHEVRNPLSAAMSALSFVSSTVGVDPPLRDKASQDSVREDVKIIGQSLTFIDQVCFSRSQCVHSLKR